MLSAALGNWTQKKKFIIRVLLGEPILITEQRLTAFVIGTTMALVVDVPSLDSCSLEPSNGRIGQP